MDFIVVEKDVVTMYDEDFYGSEDCSSWCCSLMEDDGDREEGLVELLPSDPFGMEAAAAAAAAYFSYYNVDSYDDDSASSYDPIEYLPSDPFDMEAAFGDCSDCDVDNGKEHALKKKDNGKEGKNSSGISAQRPKGGSFGCPEGSSSDAGATTAGEETPPPPQQPPHEGLVLSLGHLGVQELLSAEMVCRALRSAVQEDSLLWRCIHICWPLSERITDETLFRLSQKAHGRLECLSLVACSAITDDGLKRVLESNPTLTKLSIPGCVRLTINGLIRSLTALENAGTLCLKHLRLGRLFNITNEHYERLNALLGIEQLQQARDCKPQFYHSNLSLWTCYVERAVDIEICPCCQKLRIVYDCPSDSCKDAEASDKCRACQVCIPRCVSCGSCIKNREFVETFSLDYLCSACWKQPSDQCQDRVNENVAG